MKAITAFGSAILVVLALLQPLFAADDPLLPKIPPAAGDKCVRPTDEMRVNHMKYILHQRDLTMHKGIRTEQFSLKKCINCHVTPKADGSYPSVKTKEHFCAACHQYAAVRIDCFECHVDKPESAFATNETDQVNPDGH